MMTKIDPELTQWLKRPMLDDVFVARLVACYVARPEAFPPVDLRTLIPSSSLLAIVECARRLREKTGKCPPWDVLHQHALKIVEPQQNDPEKQAEVEASLSAMMQCLKRIEVEESLPLVLDYLEPIYRQAVTARATAQLASALADNNSMNHMDAIQEFINAVQDPHIIKAVSLPELDDMHLKPPVEVVQGLFDGGTVGILAGGSKSFKSFAVEQLAAAVVTGERWLGRGTAQGKVMVVDCELTPYDFRSRMRAICTSLGIEHLPDDMAVINLWGHTINTPRLVNYLKLRCRGYSMIVLDNLYSFMDDDADENSVSDNKRVLKLFASLARETGAFVLVCHHFSKGNQSTKDAIDRLSGSGAQGRFAYSIMTMTAHEETKCYTLEFSLRNKPPVDPFVVRFEHPILELAPELDPTKLKQLKKGRKEKYSDADLQRPIIGEGNAKSPDDWVRALRVQGCDISKDRLRARRNAWGDLLRETDGGRYYIDEAALLDHSGSRRGQCKEDTYDRARRALDKGGR